MYLSLLECCLARMQAAFLALVASKQLRTTSGGDAAYGAQLFNWAQYQVRCKSVCHGRIACFRRAYGVS